MLSTKSKIDKFLVNNHLLSLLELNGLLTAVVSGAHLSSPSAWLQLIGVKDIEFASQHQEEQVKSFLINYYNQVNTDLENGSYKIPIKHRNRKSSSVFNDACMWANAYLLGTFLWEDLLFENQELSTLLTPVMVFAGNSIKKLLQIQHGEVTEGLDEAQWILFSKLAVSVMEIYKIFNLPK
jgi:yecA family protein